MLVDELLDILDDLLVIRYDKVFELAMLKIYMYIFYGLTLHESLFYKIIFNCQ
jgi:hypothetical protein